MKVKNIDVNKFKKFKSFALIACLTGTMALTGCGNINQGEQLPTDNNSTIEENENVKMYEAEIIYSNTNNIDEYDLIAITYLDDENYRVLYAGETVYPDQENYLIDVPDSDFSIISHLCGMVDISLEEDEKAVISVDYLTKTMTVEEVKIEKSLE